MKSQNIEYKTLTSRERDVSKDVELNKYVNQKIAEGKYMIGLEVTQLYFQSRLNKNIDPQHTDNTTKRTDTSAIDHVLNNIDDLSNELAGNDICMLTTKADLDSVGAMAVLTMALEGRVSEVKTLEVKQRVEEINKYDNFTLASKWQPMPIKDAIETNKQFGAINTAVIDFKTSLD